MRFLQAFEESRWRLRQEQSVAKIPSWQHRSHMSREDFIRYHFEYQRSYSQADIVRGLQIFDTLMREGKEPQKEFHFSNP